MRRQVIFPSLIKGWMLVVLWSNAMLTPGFKARRCRSSFLNLLFVHNLFSDIDLEPLKLPYCYVSLPVKHLLKNPFLPYDSLDSSDGVRTFSSDWNCFAESMRRRKHIPYVSGISFDHPAITSGKKIVALDHDEVSVMVLATVSVIDKWTTTASSPSLNRHGLILY